MNAGNGQLRAVFMGTPEIAVPALRTLARRTTVTCVVTQPDRPAGRGNRLTAPAVKVAARELGLPVWQPESLRGAEGDTRLHGIDCFVVMAYGELLRQAVLDLPRERINLHASLLPRWRGASPLQAALRAGDVQSGVTVMRMVRELDAGPVFLHETVPIAARTTLSDLHDAIAEAAARALDRFLDAWPGGEPTVQDESQSTRCGKLTSADGHLDFTRSADELERWVRAYTPAPGCWVVDERGERLRVLAVEPRPASGLAPGVVAVVAGELVVGCGDASVAITRTQAPGGRPLPAAEFLRGHLAPERLA